MSKDVVVVVPLWKRTQWIDRVRQSVLDTCDRASVVFVVSADDQPVVDRMTRGLYDYRVLDTPGGAPGDYARKINLGYRTTTEPLIFTGADDLVFHDGWFAAASQRCHRPIGMVGTVDLCNGRTMEGTHSTHSLVARWYADLGTIDQPNMIYAECYPHDYCDDEAVETARFRGAFAHAPDSIVEHVHMLRDATLDDDVYRHGRRQARLGRRTYLRRRRLWAGVRA